MTFGIKKICSASWNFGKHCRFFSKAVLNHTNGVQPCIYSSYGLGPNLLSHSCPLKKARYINKTMFTIGTNKSHTHHPLFPKSCSLFTQLSNANHIAGIIIIRVKIGPNNSSANKSFANNARLMAMFVAQNRDLRIRPSKEANAKLLLIAMWFKGGSINSFHHQQAVKNLIKTTANEHLFLQN